MKIGMNLLLWTAHVTDAHYPIIEELKNTGFDGVEVPLFEGDVAHFQKVGQKLKSLGLGATTVTVMNPDSSPVDPDPAIRAKAVDRLKDCIDKTAALGGDILAGPLQSPLGHFTGSGPTADEKKRLADVLHIAGEHGVKNKVKLAVEQLNRFEAYCITTAEQADEIAEMAKSPAVGTLFDPFHANIEEPDIAKSILINNGRHIVHFHVSENNRGVPGSGHLPWKDIFQSLKKIGYNNWLTIESFGQRLPDLAAATRVWRPFFPSEAHVYKEGFAFIKKMWAQTTAA